MKYDIQFTNQFKKDLKLAKKQNKNLDKLFEVIGILANGGTLDAKYRDHDLTGNYKGTRECHIEPDWLLIYEICGDVLVLMLYRLGSHSELFKKYVQIVKERIEGGANEKAVWRLFINCPFVCINFDFFWLNKARQLYMDF